MQGGSESGALGLWLVRQDSPSIHPGCTSAHLMPLELSCPSAASLWGKGAPVGGGESVDGTEPAWFSSQGFFCSSTLAPPAHPVTLWQ